MTEGHRTSSIPRPARASGGVATRSAKRSKVTKDSTTGALRRVGRGDGERPGLLDDFTSSIPREKQIMQKSRGKLLVGAIGMLIALAIGAALFVLPVKSWMRQRDDLQVRTDELQTLDAANAQLQSEVNRLLTDEGITEAIRTEIDYVPEGEKRITVLPTPEATTALPAGWPYDLITSIVAIRQAEAVAAITPDQPAAPDTVVPAP